MESQSPWRLKLSISGSIFAADLVSKIAAAFLLPYGRDVPLGLFLGLRLTYNTQYVNAIIAELGDWGNGLWLFASVFALAMGISMAVANRYVAKRGFRLLIYLALALGFYFASNLAVPAFDVPGISPYLMDVLRMLGVLAFSTVAVAVARDRGYSAILAAYAGAGYGNFLSHFYPPFAVIDFIQVPLGSGLARSVVFNLADAAVALSLVSFLLYSMYKVVRSAAARFTKGRRPEGSP